MKETSDFTFEEDVLRKEKVLVKFYGTWCGPCKAIAPLIDEAVEEENLEAFAVDVDKNPNLNNQYSIVGIPCMLIFKNGVAVNRNMGMQNKDKIKEFITKGLAVELPNNC